MQGIYIYISEINYVSRLHSVAAILYWQSVLHFISPVKYVLYFYIIMFRSIRAVPSWLFFNSLILCSPGMLHVYCPSDFEMVPVAPIIADIT